jgi:hypothetical protein
MRYARGEAILRVIAMRYAPQLIVSQNEPILLANSHSPHFCIGGGRDTSEIRDDSKPFANGIRTLNETRSDILRGL